MKEPERLKEKHMTLAYEMKTKKAVVIGSKFRTAWDMPLTWISKLVPQVTESECGKMRSGGSNGIEGNEVRLQLPVIEVSKMVNS